MTDVPENIERLIVRKLDEEITEAEQLELDRELLRRPEARELLASYQEIDKLAADAIAECAEGASRRTPLLVVPRTTRPRPAASRRWMFPVSAMAACLALVVLWQTPSANGPTPQPPNTIAQGGSATQQAGKAPVFDRSIPVISAPMDGGVWPVSRTPTNRVDRSTEHNVIVVPDGEGNFYLINVDRVKEIKHPRNGTGIPTYRDPV